MKNISYADKPWMKQYELMGLPVTEPSSDSDFISIPQSLDEAVQNVPDRIATVYQGAQMSYRELKDKVDRLATALASLGIEKGDRVATLMLTSPQCGISSSAIIRCGGAMQPLSPLQKALDIGNQLKESGAKAVITFDTCLDEVLKVKDNTFLKYIIVCSLDDFSAAESPKPSEYPGTIVLRDLIDTHSPSPPVMEYAPDDLAGVMFTGGATGVPKGVMLRHSNFTSNAAMSSPLAPIQPWSQERSMIMSMHMFHAAGLASYFMGIASGSTLIMVPDPRNIEQISQYLMQYRPMVWLGAPTQWRKLLASEDMDPDILRGIIPISGMATLAPQIETEYEKKVGGGIAQTYGMTETFSAVTLNLPVFIAKTLGEAAIPEGVLLDPSSVGIPTIGNELKIMDIENQDEEVPMGEVGMIYVKGPQVMLGYWPTVGSGLTEDGWFNTGDCGYMDERGYLYITDRVKDMINVSGFKVYSKTVEDVVMKHPAVYMTAAVAAPDPEIPTNERVKLFVSLKPGFTQTKQIEEEILDLCKENLPAYARPRYMEFLDEIPVLHTEKVDKRTLRGYDGRMESSA